MINYPVIEPKDVFHWFAEISKIPRGSGNEQAVSDFLIDFAKERNLEHYQDVERNVIIKKKASKGKENAPTVILQGHMDMVCDSKPGLEHDFFKDPITWKQEGDLLYANGTTLGADDGVAVAYCLAILDSEIIAHPNLEILITSNEETGMDGANNVDPKLLNGTILINIDGEDEGFFFTSCSGGANSIIEFERETVSVSGEALKIEIKGLLGGHSGMEIQKQRGNAIRILGRLLYQLRKQQSFKIASLFGGAKHNSIANNVTCTVFLEDVSAAKNIITETFKNIKSEISKADPECEMILSSDDKEYTELLTQDLSERLTDFMNLILYGVMDYSPYIEGLVQSSSSVGILEETNNKIIFTSCVRSSVISLLHYQLDFLEIISNRVGAVARVEKEYPAWEYVEESAIRDIAIKTYKDLTGKDPIITAVHCGLETGILKALKPDLDIISYGPDLMDVHTYQEHLSIASVQNVWEYTKALLENIN